MAKKATIDTVLASLLEKNEEQYKDLDKRLDNIEKVMIAQEINLKQHMDRYNHLESIVQAIQEKDLAKVNKHVNMVEGVFKFLGVIAVVLTIVTGFIKLFTFIQQFN